MISRDLLEKFKKLYKEKYNIALTDEQTLQMANDLTNLMKVLLRPEHKSLKTSDIQKGRGQDEAISTFNSR